MRSHPPISDEELAALFTFVGRPNPPECTHTHSETWQTHGVIESAGTRRKKRTASRQIIGFRSIAQGSPAMGFRP
jgi:hypothetical protein